MYTSTIIGKLAYICTSTIANWKAIECMYEYNRWEANACTSTIIGKLVHVLVQ